MTGGFFGPTPYYYLEPLLRSTHIGGTSASNWPQWNDKKTDDLLNQYARTSDPSVRSERSGLTAIMADQL
jgi:ABC-type transport system substrate-binding protein